MKRWMGSIWVVFVMAGIVSAEMVVLDGVNPETVSTGNLLHLIRDEGLTTNVIEVSGLQISARSGNSSQKINVTNDPTEASLGINTDDVDDVTDAFEVGEKLIISFNKDIRVNRIDFNRLRTGETFTITGARPDNIVIAYDDLSNKTSGYFDTNWRVSAGTEIEFFTTGTSIVGLDGIDVTVLESTRELKLSLSRTNGMTHVAAKFNETATTNYVLQSCTNLASNDWEIASGSFSSSTNWMFETTNNSGFYRVIAD